VAYEACWDRYHYRPRESDCRSCPLRPACSTPKTVRTVIRYSEQETLEWAEAYLTSPQGRQTWAQRGVIAEGIVAEVKGFHGLRRALHRGLAKFKIQALLIASVQNLKRLVRAGDIPPASPLSRSLYFILQLRFEAAWISSATGSNPHATCDAAGLETGLWRSCGATAPVPDPTSRTALGD
jgi:hypothetical protein